MAQMARMSQFGELPDKNGTFPPNFLKKSQKLPIFDQKCSCLVTLLSGSTIIQFQPELPDLYIFCQKIGDFGIFSKKIVKYPQKHLVTRQIVTFWPFGPCMSDLCSLFFHEQNE